MPTFHIEDAHCRDPEAGAIRFLPIGSKVEAAAASWMPPAGPVRVGLTAGASTPNNKIGEAVARIFATRGIDKDAISYQLSAISNKDGGAAAR